MTKKIFKFSRRNFLYLGGSSFLALPSLLAFGGEGEQFFNQFDQPFVINVPMPLALHGRDFFGNLPDYDSTDWSFLTERSRAMSFNQIGNSISPVFSFENSQDQELIRSQMTLIAGTYNGYTAGSHDDTLCSTLFSQANYQEDGRKSENFFNHPNATIDQRISEMTGIKILNTTYMKSTSSIPRYGKTASCNSSGVLSSGVYKLDTLSSLIFGAPGGGNSGSGGSTGGSGSGTGTGGSGGTTPSLDRKKFFELALSGVSDLVKGRFGSKLSRIDRESLATVESQLVGVRNSFSILESENKIISGDLSYESSVGAMSLEDTGSRAQSNAYMDGLANMISAAVIMGKYHWVNVGSFAYFRDEFLDGDGYTKKMLTRNESHEPSHSLNDNSTSQSDGNVALLKDCQKRMYKHLTYKIIRKLSSTSHPMGGNFMDHGLVQAVNEHCSGNYHDTGAKSSSANPYYGLPVAWFGGLKGENLHRQKILDFRVKASGEYKQPLSCRHFLGRSIFNAFGITNDSQIKTNHNYHVGYYSKTDDHSAFDSSFEQIVSKSLKQLT